LETVTVAESDRMMRRRGGGGGYDENGEMGARENMKNRNICKTARKRWRCVERTSNRETRRREGEKQKTSVHPR